MSATIYQKITDRIVSELQKGIIPWQKPWTGVEDGAYSYVSKKKYSLLNQMMLSKPGAYLTFNQVTNLGGLVMKGAKAESVFFYKFMTKEVEAESGEITVKTYPVLKEYKVFHISQTSIVVPDKKEPLKIFIPSEEAERVACEYVEREAIILQDDKPSNRAFYSPSMDTIVVPMRTQFRAEGEFYSTLFHEIIHSTGHESRLNRLSKLSNFGSEEYSREELVAEMGAATLAMRMGFETDQTFRNSAGYIQGWLRKLKSDIKLIAVAAAQAEKAIGVVVGEGKVMGDE